MTAGNTKVRVLLSTIEKPMPIVSSPGLRPTSTPELEITSEPTKASFSGIRLTPVTVTTSPAETRSLPPGPAAERSVGFA